MKKIQLPLALSCIFLSLVALPFFTITNEAAAEDTIKLTFSTFFPKGHFNSVLNRMYCDEIEKRTNGKVKVTLFPGGTLTTGPKIYEGVVKGVSDIGMSVTAYVAGRFPASEIFEMPTEIESGWECSKIYNEFHAEFKLKEFEDTHILFLHGPSRNAIQMRSAPIHKPEDLKGRILRASGTSANLVRGWGGTPRAMSMGEAFEALSKSVVDGQFGTPETLKSWRHAEVVNFVTIPPISSAGCLFVSMNPKKWNSLPADVQQVFTEVSAEWIEKHGMVWYYLDIIGIDYFKKMEGKELIVIDKAQLAAWKEPLKPIIEQYIEDKSALGLPAAEYFDFIQKRVEFWAPQRPTPEDCVKWVEENLPKQ